MSPPRKLAKRAAEVLIKLEHENTRTHVVMSDIYAVARQEDVRQVRSIMHRIDLKKDAGCSRAEINNTEHVFVPENILQSLDNDMHALLL